MRVPKKNYSNLVQLLKSRGFIDLVRATRDGREYVHGTFGPPGTLLRRNILKQWWEVMVLRQSNVFPVESPTFQARTELEPGNGRLSENAPGCRESLQQDCVSKYLQVLKLTNGRLPVSVVSVGACLSWREMPTDEPEEKALLFGSSSLNRLLLQNYTAPTGASAVFDFWLQLRLSWWKKFSRNPANFSVTSSNNKNAGSDASASAVSSEGGKHSSQAQYSMRITYQFPWGPETIEEVRNLEDRHLAHLQEEGDQSYKGKTAGNKSCLPHCIECSSSIEAAMAVWLIDSFNERRIPSLTKKQENLKTSTVLQLHPQIVPYQVAIVVSTPPSSSSSISSASLPPIEVRHFCEQLERDLQKAEVSVFNTSQHGGSLDAHLRRNDQLGIPYTVIVSESALADGVISTRSRDTCIQTTSHISTVVEELKRNLKAQLEEHG